MSDRIEELLSLLVASQVLQHANSLALADSRATGGRPHPTDLHIRQAMEQSHPPAAGSSSAPSFFCCAQALIRPDQPAPPSKEVVVSPPARR